ncbi:MAG: FeoA family protein [Desulfovibrio sp.]
MRNLFTNCFGNKRRCHRRGQHSLASFPAGSKVIIRGICGQNPFRQKMFALGLTCGTEAVILESGGDSCTLLIRESKLTLGTGCASKIMADSAES